MFGKEVFIMQKRSILSRSKLKEHTSKQRLSFHQDFQSSYQIGNPYFSMQAKETATRGSTIPLAGGDPYKEMELRYRKTIKQGSSIPLSGGDPYKAMKQNYLRTLKKRNSKYPLVLQIPSGITELIQYSEPKPFRMQQREEEKLEALLLKETQSKRKSLEDELSGVEDELNDLEGAWFQADTLAEKERIESEIMLLYKHSKELEDDIREQEELEDLQKIHSQIKQLIHQAEMEGEPPWVIEELKKRLDGVIPLSPGPGDNEIEELKKKIEKAFGDEKEKLEEELKRKLERIGKTLLKKKPKGAFLKKLLDILKKIKDFGVEVGKVGVKVGKVGVKVGSKVHPVGRAASIALELIDWIGVFSGSGSSSEEETKEEKELKEKLKGKLDDKNIDSILRTFKEDIELKKRLLRIQKHLEEEKYQYEHELDVEREESPRDETMEEPYTWIDKEAELEYELERIEDDLKEIDEKKEKNKNKIKKLIKIIKRTENYEEYMDEQRRKRRAGEEKKRPPEEIITELENLIEK